MAKVESGKEKVGGRKSLINLPWGINYTDKRALFPGIWQTPADCFMTTQSSTHLALLRLRRRVQESSHPSSPNVLAAIYESFSLFILHTVEQPSQGVLFPSGILLLLLLTLLMLINGCERCKRMP